MPFHRQKPEARSRNDVLQITGCWGAEAAVILGLLADAQSLLHIVWQSSKNKQMYTTKAATCRTFSVELLGSFITISHLRSATSQTLRVEMKTLQFRDARTCLSFKNYLSDGAWILILTQVALTLQCAHSTTNESFAAQTHSYNVYLSERECQKRKDRVNTAS